MREYVVNRPEEAAMRRILERERTGPEGAVVRLAWLAGLQEEPKSATPARLIPGFSWAKVPKNDIVVRLP